MALVLLLANFQKAASKLDLFALYRSHFGNKLPIISRNYFWPLAIGFA